MTLIVLRSMGQVLGIISLNWNLSDVFLMVRLRLWAWGRKITEVRCHSYHIIKGMYYWHDLSLLMLTLTTGWATVCWVLHWKVTPSSPFHNVFFGRKSLCATHTQEEGSYVLCLWAQSIYLNYLEFISTGCFVSSPFIYVVSHHISFY